MFIFNLWGAIMLIAGLVPAFIVGGVVDEIWPNANRGVGAGGLVFFLIAPTSDLLFRWRNFRERGRIRFLHPSTGWMFGFIPIWVLFGLLPLLAQPVLLIIAPPKKDPPRRVASAPTAALRPTTPELSWNFVRSVRPA